MPHAGHSGLDSMYSCVGIKLAQVWPWARDANPSVRGKACHSEHSSGMTSLQKSRYPKKGSCQP